MSGNTESLTLKWGSLKGWKCQPDSDAFKLIQKYHEEPVSLSAMAQHDTDSQKEIIYQIIDAIDADEIYLDWDGKYVSKEEAKAYVREYGS